MFLCSVFVTKPKIHLVHSINIILIKSTRVWRLRQAIALDRSSHHIDINTTSASGMSVVALHDNWYHLIINIKYQLLSRM